MLKFAVIMVKHSVTEYDLEMELLFHAAAKDGIIKIPVNTIPIVTENMVELGAYVS